MRTSFEVLARIGRLYLAGYSRYAIAREVNLNVGTVRHFLRVSDLVEAPRSSERHTKRPFPGSWQFSASGAGSSH